MQQKISFEQIPDVLGAIQSKIDYVISRLDASATPSQSQAANSEELMTLEQACQFIGKKPSTVYSMTSDRRIPFMKRGNKLYFLKSDLMEWIKRGRCTDEPCSPMRDADTDFDMHLQHLTSGKKRKPSSMTEGR